MNDSQRGRSPSNPHQHTPSPHSNQGPFQAPSSSTNTSTTNQGFLGDQSGATSFTTNSSFGNQFDSSQASFAGAGAFNSSTGSFHNQQPTFSQPGYLDSSLPEGLTSNADFNTQGNNIFADFGSSGLNQQLDPPLYSDINLNNQQFSNPGALDPALITSQPNISPANLMNQMGTQSQTSPTPPHLLSPAMQRQASGSPHNSPGVQQSAFQPPPTHSRHTSLDPSSAAYPQNQWNGMNFQHRRAPSDAHSEVSSSAHPSPYLGNTLEYQGSPLLNPQESDPSMYQEVMGIGQFSLNEPQNPYISPHHSPQPSPRLIPQQQLPVFTSTDSYGMSVGLAPTINSTFNGNQGLDMFPGQGQEAFPALNPSDTMSPPVITFEPAPPSRQASFDPVKDEAREGALSPPESSRSRNRMRAKSDSSVGPRSHSASGSSRGESKDMLSPAAAGVGSRSPSPSGKSRRSSTSSVPNRDYLLGLADPSRSPSEASEGGTGGPKRTQKHPATFQCSLCPKRFTRAYNLRSHLRTHTDERPFVCSVCGKAFARQHDRKRHESLHSGEKKFVCRGSLKEGGSWGCGRRFARADALGRHFRSEAGRVCIKPLLEEEALERQARDVASGANAGMLPGQQPGMMGSMAGFDAYGGANPIGQGASWDPNMGGPVPAPFRLPTVILQQYPGLANMDWNAMPAGDPGYDDEISGRSSYDASGGEYDDLDEEGGYVGPQSGWASDVGAYGTGN